MNPRLTNKPADLPRELNLLDATCIVIGTTIGVGIFIVPGTIARELPSPMTILGVWVIAGSISYFGALAYAELGAMMPDSGGQYIYLREAYGPLAAFVSGWVSFLVVQSGSIAAVSVGFGIYLSYLLPGLTAESRWIPVALIVLFSLINYRGVRWTARAQNILTLLKFAGLAVLIGSSFLYKTPVRLNVDDWGAGALTTHGLVMALLGCLLAYDGWQYIALVAGEVREPSRNIPRSIALGTAAVVLLYLLANVAYLRVLPLSRIAATERVAAVTAEQTMGHIGATYRMWGYPLSPLLFTLFALWFVVNTFWTRPGSSLTGALIVVGGVPIYYLWKRVARV